ncbi:MAG: helix-turn-helix domain-containing protein [Verrucomicrobia bacterium]|nr:helix-turn-helix domain-containing protein [Verrucomicrobiota bacterium]
MYDIIIRLSRAIASRPRLRILSYLAQAGETTPTQLQRELRLPLNVLSAHLRTLCSVGLITSRRSAARCYYDFRSPYPAGTISGDTSSWLKALLRKGAEGHANSIHQPQGGHAPARLPSLHAVIFEAATAFTDLRRLQMLGYLEAHEWATGKELGEQLKMSGVAVGRQTAKLCRRGILSMRREGRSGFVFALAAQPKTAIHGQMLQMVRTTLKTKLRTSRSP